MTVNRKSRLSVRLRRYRTAADRIRRDAQRRRRIDMKKRWRDRHTGPFGQPPSAPARQQRCVVDGSVEFRSISDKPNGDTMLSSRFELVSHSDAPVTVRSVGVSLMDASGFPLNDSAWTTTMTVSGNGTLALTSRTRFPTAMADNVVAARGGGGWDLRSPDPAACSGS